MANNGTLYYRQAVTELNKKTVHPAYFIHGEEGFLIDDLVERITKAFVGKPQKEMNLFVRYAPDATLDDLISLTAGGGLFSDRKVIVYKDFQQLRNTKTDSLQRYLERPDSNICLIIIARVDSVNQAKYKPLQEMMVSIPALPLRENELLEFIEKEFQKYDKSITPEAVQTLVYLVGDKIHDLKAEIAQVVNGTPEKTVLDEADVEAIVGVYATQNVFELTRAIAQRKLEEALFILHNLLEKGESPVGILFMLLRHVTILWKIRGYYQSGERNERAIQGGLKIYPKHFAQYARETAAWSGGQLLEAMRLLKDCDRMLKSSQLSPEIAMDRLVFQLVALK